MNITIPIKIDYQIEKNKLNGSIFRKWKKLTSKRASSYGNKSVKDQKNIQRNYLLKEECEVTKEKGNWTNGWHLYCDLSDNPQVLIVGQNPYRMALTEENKEEVCLTQYDNIFKNIAESKGIKTQIDNMHAFRYYDNSGGKKSGS